MWMDLLEWVQNEIFSSQNNAYRKVSTAEICLNYYVVQVSVLVVIINLNAQLF